MSLYIWADELSSSPAALAYQAVIQDVASRAPAGEGTHSETVNLKQYLDYYPVFLSDVPLPEPYDNSWEDWDLTQALRLPVGEADVVQVDVEKAPDGTIRSVSIFAPQGPSFINESILCNGRYYIRFTLTDTEGALIPGASPAGYPVLPSGARPLSGPHHHRHPGLPRPIEPGHRMGQKPVWPVRAGHRL